jgi:hypothetical protein
VGHTYGVQFQIPVLRLVHPLVPLSVYRTSKMSIPEEKVVHDSKHGDSSPSPPSDVEVGSVGFVEETAKTVNGDEALRFLKSHHDVGELTPEGEKALLRKIDWMVMPLMWSCYCLQYLDKTLGEAGLPCQD